MSEISTATRQELVQAVGERYRTVSADEKGRILDEFVALTGYHRKHAIRVLNGFTGTPPAARRKRLRLYDEAVHQALIVSLGSVRSHLWKTAQATAPRPTPRPGTPRTSQPRPRRPRTAARGERLDDRPDAVRCACLGWRSTRAHQATPAVRRRIPVRTFADWHDPEPGFLEVDLVVHCGESMAGSFASTLVLTDIASGWIECIALLVREGELDRRCARATPCDAAVPAAGHRHRQRQRVHQRVIDHVLRRPRHRVHPIAPVSKERSSLGRAEERVGGSPARRLRTAGGHRGGRGAIATLLGLAPIRELLPALVQARRQGTGRRSCPQALPRA